jgi:hypothetical protein
MYVAHWYKSTMPGFELYLLGNIYKEEVANVGMNLFETKVCLWTSEAKAACRHQHSSNKCSFIHSQSDLKTNRQ